jgi:hypothetical protein
LSLHACDVIGIGIFCELKSNICNISGGFVEHPSPTLVAQQSVTKIISINIINLVTPKAGAMHELLFNKPALGQ